MVRGEVLYGVIIAVYDDEPFALMMTAERLFSSILGSAFSIRSVEIWNGVLPEAYRVHEEERKAKAKASKERVKVDVRPVSNGSHAPRKGKGGASSLKDTPRLNTVVERVETESEAGPSRAGTATSPSIASPKSYGLPHIETWAGLGIDEGPTTGEDSFVTASEGRTGMPPRRASQASNITMSGAVQTEKDEIMEHVEDIDLEDWHIKDWIPGVTDADIDGLRSNPEGHFDLKTGPPVRATVQVAEVSSIITASRDERQGLDQDEEHERRGRGSRDYVSPSAWQLKNALDRSMGEAASSRGPSPPPKAKADETAPRILPDNAPPKRLFSLIRRDSQRAKGGPLDDDVASNTSREDGKRWSLRGRFSRKNAAEKGPGRKSRLK